MGDHKSLVPLVTAGRRVTPPNVEPRLLRRLSAAAYLGISPASLDALRMHGEVQPVQLPVSKLGFQPRMRRTIKISLIVLAALLAFAVLVTVTSRSVGDEAANKAMRFDAGASEADIIREAGEPTDRVDASEGCREDGGTYELVYATEMHALWGLLRQQSTHHILLCMGPDKTRRGGAVGFVEIH